MIYFWQLLQAIQLQQKQLVIFKLQVAFVAAVALVVLKAKKLQLVLSSSC